MECAHQHLMICTLPTPRVYCLAQTLVLRIEKEREDARATVRQLTDTSNDLKDVSVWRGGVQYYRSMLQKFEHDMPSLPSLRSGI